MKVANKDIVEMHKINNHKWHNENFDSKPRLEGKDGKDLMMPLYTCSIGGPLSANNGRDGNMGSNCNVMGLGSSIGPTVGDD